MTHGNTHPPPPLPRPSPSLHVDGSTCVARLRQGCTPPHSTSPCTCGPGHCSPLLRSRQPASGCDSPSRSTSSVISPQRFALTHSPAPLLRVGARTRPRVPAVHPSHTHAQTRSSSPPRTPHHSSPGCSPRQQLHPACTRPRPLPLLLLSLPPKVQAHIQRNNIIAHKNGRTHLHTQKRWDLHSTRFVCLGRPQRCGSSPSRVWRSWRVWRGSQ